MIDTGDECKSYTEKYNVSIRLSSYAEKLDEMENLTEWKNEMVKLVDQTHKEVKSSAYSRRLWTLKDGEKVREVVQATRNLTDKLVVTLELFETVRVSVDEANKTVNNTVNSMENVNKTMLSALEGNGTLLYQLVGQHSEVSAQLHEAKGRLATTQGNINSTMKANENALAVAPATESLVKYVNGNIPLLSLFGYSSVSRQLRGAKIASETTHDASDAKSAALMASELPGSANSNASIVQVEIGREIGSLESIKPQLMKHLNETGINISSLTAEACDKGLSKVLNGSLVVAFSRAAGLKSSGVVKAQEALKKLKAEVGLVNAKLDYNNGSLQEAEKVLQDVDQHDEAVMSTVNSSIVEAVSGAMKDLCETMKELYTLRLDSTSLNKEAEGILANVSVLVGLFNATRNKMNEAVKTIPTAAEYFGVANKELAVSTRATNKVEKLHSTVQSEISSFLEEQMKYEKRINDTHADFMKKLFTNTSSSTGGNSPTLLDSVCGSGLPTTSPNVNAAAAFLTLQNLTNIGALNAMSKGNKLKVGKMRESLKKTNGISDNAEAAVKRAIEMALQDDARRHCTPFYMQLFNVVRRLL
ncbi:hypothetical protein ERJ75_001260400 [Trypanosoma vivax]|nr:hypothetical protein ERJ75_001260400 [Trypanosoma vivax]